MAKTVSELFSLRSMLINQFVLPTFCLCFALSSINLRGMLHHVCDVAYGENMCGPSRTRICRSANWLINYMYAVPPKSRYFSLFWCMLCTTTSDISRSTENINSTARVSRLSFRFLWLWSYPENYAWIYVIPNNLSQV